MRITGLVKTAGRSILRNKMRSFLTMLGIIIGVASVTVMVGVGKGAQRQIMAQMESMGTNVITVRGGALRVPGAVRAPGSRQTLTLKDAEQLRGVPGVTAVSAVSNSSGQVVGGAGNWQTSVTGVMSDFLKIRSWELASGTVFTARDVESSAKVALVGATVVRELFPNRDPLGEWIRIGNLPVMVVGTLRGKGESFGQDQDDIVFLPVTTVMNRMKGTRFADQITLSTATMDDVPEVMERVEEALRASHKLRPGQENDFSQSSVADMVAQANQMGDVMTMLLGAIAGISLLVGGIGIMNIMLVSVTERTREIGIRMAVGAKEGDILLQFLIEAIVLSVLGGLIGVALSFATVWGAGMFGFMAEIDPGTVAMSLCFAGMVGVFFGFHPARKAARLNPIQALRFE